ncbi:hypothetical protein F3J20_11060 [Paraburkholderia sp. Cy-641]|uniref:hypothetical protein n=1 Tax=Paraburkholderia sp. Cy-641 TaxID=2608337 RepID=UPI00141DC606|nr:hypothetical protein [Paraburkholderia sp. Cy-641]NIF77935.1 hypothetical protein [Paraburkholderia sp. Cy-641]
MSDAREFLLELVAWYKNDPKYRDYYEIVTSDKKAVLENIDRTTAKQLGAHSYTGKYHLRSLGASVTLKYKNSFKKLLSAYRKHVEENIDELTDWSLGDPELHAVFTRIIEIIVKNNAFLGSAENYLDFCFLPVPIPNACAFLTPIDRRPVMAFQEGMPLFLHKMSKIVIEICMRMPVEAYDKIANQALSSDQATASDATQKLAGLVDKAVRESADIGAIFVTTVAALVFNGTLSGTGFIPSNEFTVVPGGTLLQGMETFLVGHEIAHIFHGDLTRSEKQEEVVIDGHETDLIIPASDDELAADILGLTLLWNIVAKEGRDGWFGDTNSAIMLSAPDVFFSLYDMLYIFIEAAAGFSVCERYDSHPSPIRRREVIRQYRQVLFAKSGATETSLSHFLGLKYDYVIKSLTYYSISIFRNMLADGNKISPVWVPEWNS